MAVSSGVSSQTQSLESLLASSQGFTIGEEHHTRVSSQYLLESLESIKRIGVRYLFIEDFPFDQYQAHVNAYINARAEAAMPKELANALRFRDVCYTAYEEDHLNPSQVSELQKKAKEGDPEAQQKLENFLEKESRREFNRTKLYKKAKQLGIQIIQIDDTHLKGLGGKERLEAMNAFATKMIKSAPLGVDEKFVVLTGIAHSTTTMKVTGLNERLETPVIHIRMHTNSDVRERLSASPMTYTEGDERYAVDLGVIMPKSTPATGFDIDQVEVSQEDIAFFE